VPFLARQDFWRGELGKEFLACFLWNLGGFSRISVFFIIFFFTKPKIYHSMRKMQEFPVSTKVAQRKGSSRLCHFFVPFLAQKNRQKTLLK
jgi:hypothetical protein